MTGSGFEATTGLATALTSGAFLTGAGETFLAGGAGVGFFAGAGDAFTGFGAGGVFGLTTATGVFTFSGSDFCRVSLGSINTGFFGDFDF